MITAGIDAGSRTIKVVLLDGETKAVVGSGIANQGTKQAKLAADLLDQVCRETKVERESVQAAVATGYGRNTIKWANKAITEITCHASGVHHLVADARTIIDIGGQDSKIIRLDTSGRVQDFIMNDRCAAGTGRFLEVVATRLEMEIDEMGELAKTATAPSAISSMCVVFAETEIVGLLADGAEPNNIAAGVERSIASRVRSMGGNKLQDPIVFAGGVALIPGMAEIVADIFQRPIEVAPEPQLTGALGAAILATRI